MSPAEADERYDRLLADVTTLAETLRAGGDVHWARWFESARLMLLEHDGAALAHLRAAYGGMGSFNDLPLDAATEPLRARVHDDATALLTDLRR